MIDNFSRHTHLETGLILTLVVTVPFLISMIAIYVCHGVIWWQYSSNSINCTWTCIALDNFYQSLYKSLDIGPPENDTGISDLSEDDQIRSPNIAAIIKRSNRTDEYEQSYICSAVVISKRYLLASSYCVPKNDTNVYARIGSQYWSRGGCLYQYENVRLIRRNYALIELKRNISDENASVVQLGQVEQASAFNITGWNQFSDEDQIVTVRVQRKACDENRTEGYFCGLLNLERRECFERDWFFPFLNCKLIGVPHIDNMLCEDKGPVYRFYSINNTEIEAQIKD